MAVSEGAVPAGRFTLPGAARLRKGTDILRVLKTGRSVGCKGMKMAWLPSAGGVSRMAIALRRGYGNAVMRNRAKRLVREAWRLCRGSVGGAWDIVFQVFPSPDLWTARSDQVRDLLRRSGLSGPAAGNSPALSAASPGPSGEAP